MVSPNSWMMRRVAVLYHVGVFITCTFGGEVRTFIVSLDLVARTASVARSSSDDRYAATDRPGRWSPEGGIELSE